MSATPPWDLDAQPPDVAVLLWSPEAFAAISRDRNWTWFARKTEHGEYEYFWVDPVSGYRFVAAILDLDDAEGDKQIIRNLLQWSSSTLVVLGIRQGAETVNIPGQVDLDGHILFSAPKALLKRLKHLPFAREELDRWPDPIPVIRTHAFSEAHIFSSPAGYSLRAIYAVTGLEKVKPLKLLILGCGPIGSLGANAKATRDAFTALRLLGYFNLLPKSAASRPVLSAPQPTLSTPPYPVRALQLEIRNIRCFSTLSVEFGRNDSPTDWTVLLGNNAAGKSTILRILALALAPSDELGAMLHADGHGWAGPDGPAGELSLTLVVAGQPRRRTLKLQSEGRSTTFEIEGDGFDELPLLLAGYGAARQLQGTKELSDDYSLLDSTSTLMAADGALQNPELAVRRAIDAGDKREVLEQLDEILLLDRGSTQLGPSGLQVRGPDGETRPLAQLSDGYRSTLAWVADFIGWQFMASRSHGRSSVPAIVILDEIEQHLHPSWQRKVIKRLREQFPAVQFIVSTHAPLCVLGTTDLRDDEVSLVYVERGRDAEGHAWSIARSGMLPPRGKRADQVLTSYLFGLSSARDDETDRNIFELSQLRGLAEPSDEQRERIDELQRLLEPLLGSAETELEQEVQQAGLEAAERVVRRKLEQLTPQERERILGRLPAPAAEEVQRSASLRHLDDSGKGRMHYNFRDDPTPALQSTIDATGSAALMHGPEQGDELTASFTGSSIMVSITPPTGWSLQSVRWSNGSSGVLTVPPPGVEESHRFDFTLAQNGNALTCTGKFTVKKVGNSTGGS